MAACVHKAGMSVDFKKAVADVPRRPDGKVASLKTVQVEATQLAEDMVAMLERRASEAAARSARSRSESIA